MAVAAGLVVRVPGFPARHAFSTLEMGSMGLTGSPDARVVMARRHRFAREVGFELENAVLAAQVHGARVATFQRSAPAPGGQSVLETDALATDISGQALLTYHADCFPVLFADPVHGVVAAAHAGWRGTLEGVAAQTIQSLAGTYGSRPQQVLVLIGPGICHRCYPVGAEVAAQFEDRFGQADRYLATLDGRLHLDLAAAVRLQLEGAGVPLANIRSANSCTREDARWFSHRGGRPGRFFAAIVAP